MDTNDGENPGLVKRSEKRQSQDTRSNHKQTPSEVKKRGKAEEFQ